MSKRKSARQRQATRACRKRKIKAKNCGESPEEKERHLRTTRRDATRRRRARKVSCDIQARLAFQKAIGEYPRNVCMSCKKLCYSSVGSSVNEEKVPYL